MTETNLPQTLSPIEARILGVLIEKAKTTPDAYPLTVNSLTAGCNQKTSRDPVMSVSESEVQSSLEELRSRTLIMESYGASGRVLRYAHNFAKVYDVPAAGVDLLAVLILRGPQTASETARQLRTAASFRRCLDRRSLSGRTGGALHGRNGHEVAQATWHARAALDSFAVWHTCT